MEEHSLYAPEGPDTPATLKASDPVVPPPFGSAENLRGVFIMFFLMMLGMIVVGGLIYFLFGFAIPFTHTGVRASLIALNEPCPGWGFSPQPSRMIKITGPSIMG